MVEPTRPLKPRNALHYQPVGKVLGCKCRHLSYFNSLQFREVRRAFCKTSCRDGSYFIKSKSSASTHQLFNPRARCWTVAWPVSAFDKPRYMSRSKSPSDLDVKFGDLNTLFVVNILVGLNVKAWR